MYLFYATLRVAVPIRLGSGKNAVWDTLDFRVTQLTPQFDILLGTPWLARHNPAIDWRTGAIKLNATDKSPAKVLHGHTPGPPTAGHTVIPATDDSPRIVLVTGMQMEDEVDLGEEIFACYLLPLAPQKEGEEASAPLGAVPEGMPPPGPAANFVRKHMNLFEEPTTLPPLLQINHKIELVDDAQPTRHPAYSGSPLEHDEAKRAVTKLLELGHARRSYSSYAAPILFVKRKNGELRMCVDYRRLNKITVRHSFPMPRAEDLMNQLHGATVFSQIDMISAFHQMRIEPKDVHKSAFITFGLYEFLVTPFGMINSPASLQSLLNDIFRDYLNEFVVIYLDDILIFSRNTEDHARYLDIVAALLQKHELRLQLKKCNFKSEVNFLGHIVGKEGIKTDPAKVDAMRKWPTPTCVKHVKQWASRPTTASSCPVSPTWHFLPRT